MAEYSNNAVQTVASNGTVVFGTTVIPCKRGFIKHREESGIFILSGYVPMNQCGCCNNSADYLCMFSANIAIPTGGTVDPISLAFSCCCRGIFQCFLCSNSTNMERVL